MKEMVSGVTEALIEAGMDAELVRQITEKYHGKHYSRTLRNKTKGVFVRAKDVRTLRLSGPDRVPS